MKTNTELLVDGLRIAIIGSMVPFVDKFPILRTILNKSQHPSDDWDFFMLSAGIGTYFLTNESSKEEANEIADQLSRIDKQIPDAIHNFFNYINKGQKAGINLVVDIGYWVLWNITGNEPTYEECKELAPAIGTYLMKLVGNFLK